MMSELIAPAELIVMMSDSITLAENIVIQAGKLSRQRTQNLLKRTAHAQCRAPEQ